MAFEQFKAVLERDGTKVVKEKVHLNSEISRYSASKSASNKLIIN